MNRSRRRATVICWAIAAGVLYGGLAPAGAEPPESDATGTAEGSVGSAAEDSAGPRRPSHQAPAGMRVGRLPPGTRPGRQPAGPPAPAPGGADHHGHEWECRWWPVVVTPRSVDNDRRGWLGIPIAAAVPVSVPVPVPLPGAVPSAVPSAVAGPPAGLPIPSMPVEPPAPPAAPAVGPTTPGGLLQPGPAPAVTRSTPSIGVTTGPLRLRADFSAAPPASVRPGYPEYLRRADIAQMASVALPGLAAIAGMTALGGVVGYRQARAAYLLRAAGAGRFLR